jgi:pyruvate,water dikinase
LLQEAIISKYIYSLKKFRDRKNIGSKAKNLRFLIRNGYNVPNTYICTWDAYISYISGGKDILNKISSELKGVIRDDVDYAVRSSANIEDDIKHSFAGQFRTVLNVNSVENITRAIKSVWDSAKNIKTKKYLKDRGLQTKNIFMAVIIQEMVRPVFSGVSFSKNPVTGLSEIIIEAVEGSGERFLQKGITPMRWIRKWGAWVEVPEEEIIPVETIEKVGELTKILEDKYGSPIDLEWVFDGNSVYLVQLRSITKLDINIYSNKISREFLPGIIKPLVWSVNTPLVNGAWVEILSKLTGNKDLDPSELSKQFYYRAYFDMKVFGKIFDLFGFPRETLELLIGIELEGPEKPSFKPGLKTYLLTPRILWFSFSLIGLGRRLKVFMSKMKKRFEYLSGIDIEAVNEKKLMSSIDRIFYLGQKTAYYNIIVPILAMAYNRILQQFLKNIGLDYNSVDLGFEKDKLMKYNPHFHIARLKDIYRSGSGNNSIFEKELQRFIKDFGHFSDSGNDFSIPPWRENEKLLRQMIINFENKEAEDVKAIKIKDIKLPFFRRHLSNFLGRLAKDYTINREAISSLYTFGYGQFRDYFLSMGKLLKKKKYLREEEDIFYLYLGEIRDMVEKKTRKDWMRIVSERKRDIEKSRHYKVPDIIYGNDESPIFEGPSSNLRGIPTSHGSFTGPAKVLKGLKEMDKMENGDILIIPYSEVGFTPLFSKAGAVVSESGGILSHSSILARELGIPAVLSVNNACSIPDNTIITVDGYKGEVIIHEKESKDV